MRSPLPTTGRPAPPHRFGRIIFLSRMFARCGGDFHELRVDDIHRASLRYVFRQPGETRARLPDPRRQARLTLKAMLRRSIFGHRLRVTPRRCRHNCIRAAETVPAAAAPVYRGEQFPLCPQGCCLSAYARPTSMAPTIAAAQPGLRFASSSFHCMQTRLADASTCSFLEACRGLGDSVVTHKIINGPARRAKKTLTRSFGIMGLGGNSRPLGFKRTLQLKSLRTNSLTCRRTLKMGLGGFEVRLGRRAHALTAIR